MTRQPIKGRKFGGGIRFGEMERDALLAHGAAYLLHDRLHTCSDYTVMEVCSACGSLLSPNQFIPSAAAADMPRAAGGKQLHIAASIPCAMMLYRSMMCLKTCCICLLLVPGASAVLAAEPVLMGHCHWLLSLLQSHLIALVY